MFKKVIITIIAIMALQVTARAESLFVLGTTQNYMGTPRSLFGGVQARNVGDLITIILEESVTSADTLTYSSSRESATVDNFTSFINKWFNLNLKDSNNYGGSNEVTTSANANRNLTFGDKIAVQVTQQMPNGNLMVQGKKVLVNGNERVDLVVTGVVDPRWITTTGQVSSKNVANLQFALSGRGSTSRGQNEGILNRIIRYLI